MDHLTPLSLIMQDITQVSTSRSLPSSWTLFTSPASPNTHSHRLAEWAVHSAKQLMERSHRDRTDVFLNLLNIKNIPRDKTLGSPACNSSCQQQTASASPKVHKAGHCPAPNENTHPKAILRYLKSLTTVTGRRTGHQDADNQGT